MTSYVHKLFHFRCKARSFIINLIYVHYQTRFPTTQQSTCITQSYGKFVYRTQSHLAQTPHSSPDQLKVTVQKFHERFSVLRWVVWHTCADVQRSLWLPSTELRWKQQVPLKYWNSTASMFVNLNIWDLKLHWLPVSIPLFQLSTTAHFHTIVLTSPNCLFHYHHGTFCDWFWQITMSSLGFRNFPTTAQITLS